MVTSINLLTLVAPVLLGSASAGKTCDLKVGPSCGVTGWDRDQGNYDFDGSGDYSSYHACSARCLASGQCSSFAYGDGECLLYDIPVAGNFDYDPDSPFTFYDLACLLETNSTSSPSGTIGTATSTSISASTTTTTPAGVIGTAISTSISVSSSGASTSISVSTTTPAGVVGTATSTSISALSSTTTPAGIIGTAISTSISASSSTTTPAGVIGTAISTHISASSSSTTPSAVIGTAISTHVSSSSSTTTLSAIIGTAISTHVSVSSSSTTPSAVIGTATSTELSSTTAASSSSSLQSALLSTTSSTSSKAAATTPQSTTTTSKASSTTSKALSTSTKATTTTTTSTTSTTAKSSTITTTFKSTTTAKTTTSTTSTSSATVSVPPECTNIAPTMQMTTFDWFNSTNNLDCANPNFASDAQVCWNGQGLCAQGEAGCICAPYCMTGVPQYAYQPLGFGPADTINVGLDGDGSTCFASNPSSIRRTELGEGHFDCGSAADIMGFTGSSNKDSGNMGSIYYNGVFNTCNGKTPVYKATFALSCTHDSGFNATCTAASLPVTLQLASLS